MKCLERNKRTCYYCTYNGRTEVTDSKGYKTGEWTVSYSEPIELHVNISAATGTAQTEQFGQELEYDRVIVTDDIDIPVDENTVFFIDMDPVFEGEQPLYDYTVRKVAKSLNSVSIALRKVRNDKG